MKFIRVIGVFGLSVLLTAQFASVAYARIGDTTTWLGAVYRGDGGDANSAHLDNPFGFTADAACNLTIADTQNNVVRSIVRSTNIISTYAGTGQYGFVNGASYRAQFKSPYDLEIGPEGEVYVLDAENKAVRIIRNGNVTTWLTNLKNPTGSYLDGTTLYISETGNNRIVKATIPAGSVTTVATIASPGKMTMHDGALYVINDGKTALSRVDLGSGAVTELRGTFADAEGIATYNDEIYFTAGADGLYNEIWKFTPATDEYVELQHVLENNTYNHASDLLFCGGNMFLLFKGGSSVYVADLDGGNPLKIAGHDRYGNMDGPKAVAMLGRPKAMVMSKDRTKVYILENHVFKSFSLKTGTLSFVSGFARDNWKDLSDGNARMSGPTQMVLSPDGTRIYFADRNNNRIRELIISERRMNTISGAGIINTLGERNGYAEGNDCHTNFAKSVAGCAYFDRPMGIAVSLDGKTLYVADTTNNRIRTVDVSTGRTRLLAGSGVAGLRDGTGSAARFKSPVSLLLSRDGRSLYVLEQGNHALRKIDLRTKRVTKLIGSGKAGYRDGLFRDARLSYPDSLALGPGNSLFITEVGTQKIRRVNLDAGTISTVAGAGSRGFVNGRGNVAKFNNPRGMVMLNSAYLLVADQSNDMIRAVRIR